jgi:hypothetical protein
MIGRVLGAEMAEKISGVKAEEWYPIELLLGALDEVDAKVGTTVLRQVGLGVFDLSHAQAAKEGVKVAADIIFYN